MPVATEDHLSGRLLYGDDFLPDEIAEWHRQEENAFLDLMTHAYGVADADGNYAYEYDALNRAHAVDRLAGQHFPHCVALGCASGDDVRILAPLVDRFTAIEPAETFWRPEIGGRPSTYIKPSVTGDLPLQSESADLATAFGVLHHIPNVSHVVGEIGRVLKPGGLFLVREPISWMGDWRRPRPGLTANERGVPVGQFERIAASAGFEIVSRRYCMFAPLAALMPKLGFNYPFTKPAFVALDRAVSAAFSWNVHYRRDSIAKKFAASSAFWILRRSE